MTYAKVILKFVYDHINISFKNAIEKHIKCQWLTCQTSVSAFFLPHSKARMRDLHSFVCKLSSPEFDKRALQKDNLILKEDTFIDYLRALLCLASWIFFIGSTLSDGNFPLASVTQWM